MRLKSYISHGTRVDFQTSKMRDTTQVELGVDMGVGGQGRATKHSENDQHTLADLKKLRGHIKNDGLDRNLLHVHVDAPEETVLDKDDGVRDTGHSWVGFEAGTEMDFNLESTYASVGLYPGDDLEKKGIRKLNPKIALAGALAGMDGFEALHIYESDFELEDDFVGEEHYVVELNDKAMLRALDKAIRIIERDPLYRLDKMQCTKFVQEVLEKGLRRKVDSREHIADVPMDLPLLKKDIEVPIRGTSPRGLADELVRLSKVSGLRLVDPSEYGIQESRPVERQEIDYGEF